METTVTSAGAKAIMISLILIVLSLGFYLAGIRGDSPMQYLIYAVLFAGIIVSITMYGKQISYNATFGNYFAHGFKVAAFVTIIMVAYLVIFVLVFPEYKVKMMAEGEKKMRSDPKITDEQLEQGLSMMRKGFMVFLIAGTLLFNLVIGAIAALLGAAITKKDKNHFQQDINKLGT